MMQFDYDLVQPSDRPTERMLPVLALALFDGTIAAHGLPSTARPLLALAATYLAAIPPERRAAADRIGRDQVLAAPIPNLTADQQAIVASVLAFQRAKVRPQREPTFWRLDERDQETALALAAILSLADALRAAPLDDVVADVRDGTTTVLVSGAQAVDVAAAASTAVKQWTAQIGPLDRQSALPHADGLERPRAVSTARAALDTLSLPAAIPSSTDLGSLPVAEAARQLLRHCCDKLLAREAAVRKGEEVEDVHQMRVATRRLRASLQVVEGIYDHELIRRYRRARRRTRQRCVPGARHRGARCATGRPARRPGAADRGGHG